MYCMQKTLSYFCQNNIRSFCREKVQTFFQQNIGLLLCVMEDLNLSLTNSFIIIDALGPVVQN